MRRKECKLHKSEFISWQQHHSSDLLNRIERILTRNQKNYVKRHLKRGFWFTSGIIFPYYPFVVELFNEPTLNIIFSGLSLKLHSSRVRPVNLLPSLELIWIDEMNIKVRIRSPGSVYITMRTWRNIKGNVNVILCDPPFKEGHRWFTTTLLP